MILSGNSIDHALLMLGGFVAGVPVVPVSVAYSLLSQDFAKLRAIFGDVRPGLVFAEQGRMFARALGALDLAGVEVVTRGGEAAGLRATPFSVLLEPPATDAVEKAFQAVGPDSVAKVLFPSGSTGLPKGVINTHGMLCANQQMLAQVWPFTEKTPPVLVDWLPWNHTFGGNHNFNLVLKRVPFYQHTGIELSTLMPQGQNAPEGVFGTANYLFYYPDTKENKSFAEEFQKRFHRHPKSGAVYGYMAAQFLEKAYAKAGKIDKEKFIDALEGMTADSPIGTLEVRACDHQIVLPMYFGVTRKSPRYEFLVAGDILSVSGKDYMPSCEEIMKERAK